jgi:hypothetical protein
MGVRLGAALSILLFASPAIAAGTLPFEGAFGNDAGCLLYNTGRTSPDYQLLTPDTYASPAIGCDFNALVSSDGVVFVVDAVCSPGGKSTVRVSDLGKDGYAVSVDDKDGLVRELKACPPAGPDQEGHA